MPDFYSVMGMLFILSSSVVGDWILYLEEKTTSYQEITNNPYEEIWPDEATVLRFDEATTLGLIVCYPSMTYKYSWTRLSYYNVKTRLIDLLWVDYYYLDCCVSYVY